MADAAGSLAGVERQERRLVATPPTSERTTEMTFRYWRWRIRIDVRYWMRTRIYIPVMTAYNWFQGCRFFWVETHGSPGGGYLNMTEKCCPYPIQFDWSVKACVKAGYCGCIKGIDDPEGGRL